MREVDNRLVIDSEWVDMEKEPEIPKGYFDQWGGFVHQDYLWEVAAEEVAKDGITKDRFLEKVLDYIESNEEAKKKFLGWYYPDYGKEK